MSQIALDQDYTFYIGTYSDIDVLAHQPYAPTEGDGIHIAKMSRDGSVEEVSSQLILNPAVLIPHPDKPKLYGIVETIKNNGSVVEFDIGADKALVEGSTFHASGKSTCYLALSPNRDIAIVINYWDAIIDVVAVAEDGTLGEIVQSFKQLYRRDGEWRQVEYREDHWENRQVGPHAHCAHFWGDYRCRFTGQYY